MGVILPFTTHREKINRTLIVFVLKPEEECLFEKYLDEALSKTDCRGMCFDFVFLAEENEDISLWIELMRNGRYDELWFSGELFSKCFLELLDEVHNISYMQARNFTAKGSEANKKLATLMK